MRILVILAALVCCGCQTSLDRDAATVDPGPWDPEAGSPVVGETRPRTTPPETPEERRKRFQPITKPGRARLLVRTVGGWKGARGEMKYMGQVVAIDGKRIRASRRVSVPAGRHLIKIAWKNYQVDEWAGIDETGDGMFSFLQKGESELVMDVVAGRFYEVEWPTYEEPGGPEGFKDVTRPR